MYKKLSETEMLIMQELWAIGKPTNVKSLAEWLLTTKNIDWKVQTIATFLTRMEKKKYVAFQKGEKAKEYFPAITREEMKGIEAKGLLEDYYEGSFKKFLVALTSGNISDEKADELEQWLLERTEEGVE